MAVIGDLLAVVRLDDANFRAGIQRMQGSFKKLNRGVKSASAAVFSLRGAFAAVGAVGLGRSLVNASVSLERINNTMRAATGSAAGAAAEMSFVRSEAQRLGLDLESSATQFAQLAAAAKGTSLAGAQTREIFTAVSEASTVLGLSSEQTRGALRALEQMISKGNVQAEELRGQLGERLPGAFQIAARAMGVTTEKLNDMLETGDVAADQLLPALAKELRATFGPEVERAAKSTQATLNRLNTSLFQFSARVGDALVKVLTPAFNALSSTPCACRP